MLSESLPVFHSDPEKVEFYGRGRIQSYTQVMSQDEEGQPQILWLFMVSWENQRTPALSFHPAEELTNDLDFDSHDDLDSIEFDEDEDDDNDPEEAEVIEVESEVVDPTA